ncbi:MAG: choice-of-anchor B family protein [Gemmatimonadetes bacterium]|nr:choice-of-anchor B family protein [Gemmatimonadota bacterium]
MNRTAAGTPASHSFLIHAAPLGRGLAAAAFFAGATAAIFAVPVTAQSGSFGHSVVVADGEIVVAEPTTNFRPGTVYVYRKSDGEWDVAQVLNAPEPEIADGFGTVLAMSDNHLFVGQRGGPVHIFGRSAGSWSHVAQIADARVAGSSPSCSFDGYCGTDFGITLAASGRWLMVGAPGPSAGAGPAGDEEPPRGAVHVYRNTAGGWVHHTELGPEDGEAGDRFGAAMAAFENRLIVSAPGWSAGGEISGAGRIYYTAFGGDTWDPPSSIESTPAVNADLGAALAMDEGGFYAGAPGMDEGQGAVFRYAFHEDGPGSPRRLDPPGGMEGDRFGASLAIVGHNLWVGSPTEREEETGSIWVYPLADGEPTGNPTRFALAENETVERDRFGGLVAGTGEAVAVSAPGMHHRSGSVHLFEPDQNGTWAMAETLVSAPDAIAPILGEEHRCDDGKIGPFDCDEVELLSYVPGSILKAAGSARGVRANDNWGWTDSTTGREYALVGRNDGTSFVDITDPANPVLVGDLPKPGGTPPSQLWRDIKTYRDHAFIVADGAGDHGMQVFDLARLREASPDDMPLLFEPDVHYRGVASSHNIVINEETGFAYAVGSRAGRESCGGGLHMIDIRAPQEPVFAGCYRDESGTHDSQCVVYRGPDERYQGRELCLNSNGRFFEIADVTDKENPVHVSRATSPNAAYIHQGWLTPDHRYFYQDDEADVIAGAVETTRTLIWDLSDIEDPVLAREYMGSLPASAHNLYIKDGFVYQANYRYGLHVLDISDPLNPREVGAFDTAPYAEGPGFGGAWSVYPYFESGTVIVTSMQEGLFVLRRRRPVS